MRKKIPHHIRNYIKQELYNYENNKKLLKELQDGKSKTTSRTILIVTKKIQNIDNALSKIAKEDKEVVKNIFFKGHSQVYAQMHDNISKDMYYDVMNKMIYLTAIEYDEL